MSHQTPEFKRKLGREIHLFIREIMDGCNDCRAMKCLCYEHRKTGFDLFSHPQKYLEWTGTSFRRLIEP
jgi:hypothetical protein